MRGEVAVAEVEPGLAAELRGHGHEGPRFARQSPAGLGVVDAGERVHHGVEVGRDAKAEVLEVIARVDDDRKVLAEQTVQAVDELRAAEDLRRADAVGGGPVRRLDQPRAGRRRKAQHLHR